ncbi:MAG: protein TolQ [Gammaproteobacteria bacterium]|nr:protein TolQ [Gammaproteobacteria bacterium]MCH9743726.1 protein TolQ [Gammaproteobacteria bacterium]
MGTSASFWSFIIDASFVVKLVIMLLIIASVFSWMLIFQRTSLLKRTRKQFRNFDQQFWSGSDMQHLFDQLSTKVSELTGSAAIFYAGMQEFIKSKQHANMNQEAIMEGTSRAMRIALQKEMDRLEKNLSFLATVGSTSPYIGLFGTVWGIMTSFQALGTVQQATIAMVAPGISEALIATAIGLFAAIPAVIAYNRFSNQLERLQSQYETFQESFTNILHREAYAIDEVES